MRAYHTRFSDDELIRAIRGQQARVRQTHREYRLACEGLRTLCEVATRVPPETGQQMADLELQGQR